MADRQPAEQEQMPGLFEGAPLGQLDGGVLAVVVEALVPAHIAESGLGRDHVGQPTRDVDEGVVHPVDRHGSSVDLYELRVNVDSINVERRMLWMNCLG